ncbi:MAG: hypothetical protein E7563_05395 [Ruminococcaceae bacterium]|nr:hypothetical protein [Oscillospiraceae bacterium]
MKKLGCVLLGLVLMFSLFACGGDTTETTGICAESTTQTESVTEYSESLTEKVTDTVSENTVYELLSERLIREIDGEYKEKQELPENCTTVGMLQLTDEYCEKWELVADEYYNKLMEYDEERFLGKEEYSSEKVRTLVSGYKTNWEKYKDEDFRLYSEIVRTVNGGGSAVPVISSDYRYEETMEWALKLVEICERLHIE